MTIRAVLLDIGGVLETTPPTGWQRAWCERLHLDPTELDRRLGPVWAAGEIGDSSLDEVEKAVATALALDQKELRDFMDDLWTEYLGSPNQEMVHFLAGLRPRYRTGIPSNSFVGARERERAAFDFEAACDVVIYSHEERMKKPDPRFFALACERLGVSPSEVLFVDDVASHIGAARRLGMHGVVFTDTSQALAEMGGRLADHGP